MKLLILFLGLSLSVCSFGEMDSCSRHYKDLSDLLSKHYEKLKLQTEIVQIKEQVYSLENRLDALEVDLLVCYENAKKLRLQNGFGDEWKKYYRSKSVINRTQNFIDTYFYEKKLERPYTVDNFIVSIAVMVEKINK